MGPRGGTGIVSTFKRQVISEQAGQARAWFALNFFLLVLKLLHVLSCVCRK